MLSKIGLRILLNGGEYEIPSSNRKKRRRFFALSNPSRVSQKIEDGFKE